MQQSTLLLLVGLIAFAPACEPGGDPPPEPPERPPFCLNTCPTSFDGECDDGTAGSVTDFCAPGTDCADCATSDGGTPVIDGAVPGGGVTWPIVIEGLLANSVGGMDTHPDGTFAISAVITGGRLNVGRADEFEVESGRYIIVFNSDGSVRDMLVRSDPAVGLVFREICLNEDMSVTAVANADNDGDIPLSDTGPSIRVANTRDGGDQLVIHYTPDGGVDWYVHGHNSPSEAGTIRQPPSLTCLGDGGTVVAGSFEQTMIWQTSDGREFFNASARDTSSGIPTGDIYLVRLDSAGQPLWQRLVASTSVPDARVASVVEAANGDILFAGNWQRELTFDVGEPTEQTFSTSRCSPITYCSDTYIARLLGTTGHLSRFERSRMFRDPRAHMELVAHPDGTFNFIWAFDIWEKMYTGLPQLCFADQCTGISSTISTTSEYNAVWIMWFDARLEMTNQVQYHWTGTFPWITAAGLPGASFLLDVKVSGAGSTAGTLTPGTSSGTPSGSRSRVLYGFQADGSVQHESAEQFLFTWMAPLGTDEVLIAETWDPAGTYKIHIDRHALGDLFP